MTTRLLYRGWNFGADLAVRGTHFRLSLPLREPLLITSIHYTDFHYIVLEGETREPIYSVVSIDGSTATAPASAPSRACKEEERTQTQAKTSPFLF
jgi:hypothetical protein